MTASLLSEARGSVLLLTIDRPERRNALDPDTLAALTGALTSAPDGVGAAVLTGAGGASFSSGMDLRAVSQARSGEATDIGAVVSAFHAAMEAPNRIPLVAAVRGMAIGGGFELMLRCDLSVVAAEARLAMPEVGRGLVPGGGALQWPARMPLPLANELVLLGDDLDPERAYNLGLVNRVVPDGQVVGTAVELAARLAAQPASTLRRARSLLAQTVRDGAAASEAAFRALRPEELLSPAALAGLKAFAGDAHPTD